jgi:hypothetical protein
MHLAGYFRSCIMMHGFMKVKLTYFSYLYVLGGVIFRMTLRVVPSDRDVRTRPAASRSVDLETRYVIVYVGACCGRGGEIVTSELGPLLLAKLTLKRVT